MHKKYISQIAPPPPKKNGILDNNYVFRQIFIRKYEQQPQVVQTHDLLFLKGGGGGGKWHNKWTINITCI